MNSVEALIDEIQVVEHQEVEVWLVLLDEAVAEPEVLVTYSLRSPLGDWMYHRCLRKMPAILGMKGQVKTIVHGGGDQWTVHTDLGDVGEISLMSAPECVSDLTRLAWMLASVAGLRPNSVPPRLDRCEGFPQRPRVNQVTEHDGRGGPQHGPAHPFGSSPNAEREMPGDMNPWPGGHRGRLRWVPPNKARSA